MNGIYRRMGGMESLSAFGFDWNCSLMRSGSWGFEPGKVVRRAMSYETNPTIVRKMTDKSRNIFFDLAMAQNYNRETKKRGCPN